MHAVFVYCSVIRENLVGTKYMRLLRIVPTHEHRRKMIHVAFQNPQYVEVAFDRISSIRLTLCNDQVEPIKFTVGK